MLHLPNITSIANNLCIIIIQNSHFVAANNAMNCNLNFYAAI